MHLKLSVKDTFDKFMYSSDLKRVRYFGGAYRCSSYQKAFHMGSRLCGRDAKIDGNYKQPQNKYKPECKHCRKIDVPFVNYINVTIVLKYFTGKR